MSATTHLLFGQVRDVLYVGGARARARGVIAL